MGILIFLFIAAIATVFLCVNLFMDKRNKKQIDQDDQLLSLQRDYYKGTKKASEVKIEYVCRVHTKKVKMSLPACGCGCRCGECVCG